MKRMSRWLQIAALAGALPASALEYGQLAPDFTLNDTWGNTHTLSDYRGRVVYINFFGCT